ncbi:DUF4097 family beta strand repeat-containing protein [Nocardia terpenica]|uniref:DUF4097 family beta strand repeat protein n=1 Tax=Nocardia terpenica TaxID=455432 RepID=A0A6G9ZA52_9NOCA|nr:DUF4097 family beta strand repeat-containing protein [Nocardia terpenica]QIS22046.1 DUF4097 family beta strand repeat protein [Nocardia terpenica]
MQRSARQLSAILGTVACGMVVPFGAACSDLGPASDHIADDALVTGSPAVIEIHNGSGSVRVTPGDAVHVHREIAYRSHAPAAVPDRADGTLVLSAECDRCRIDYTVTAPASTKVVIFGSSGSVDVEGVSQVTYRGVSGSATIRKIAGPVDVQSGSGSVTVSDVAPTVTATTTSGNIGIDLSTAPNRLTAHSGSGHVSVTVPAHPYRIETHTDSGSVHNKIPDTAGAADTLTVDSGSGDIDLATP